MRLAIAKFQSVLRPTPTRPLTAAAAAATASFFSQIALTEEVIHILTTVPTIEPSLDILAPHLTPHVISTVLDSPAPIPAFRFFIWASAHRRLRSWRSHNRVIALLRNSPSTAWDTLNHLKTLSIPIPSPAFTVLISAYSAAKMPEKAIDAFARMRDFHCHHDTFTYNTVLRIMVESGVGILALAVYSQMVKGGDSPNRATYNILIDWLTKTGKGKEANRLLDEMLGRGIVPNTMLYTVFVNAECKNLDFDAANKLFREMQRVGCKPDLVTYNVLLDGFCKMNRVDEAIKLLGSFREEGYELGLNGYSCLIDGLFKSNRFEEACGYYREMLERNVMPDCLLYTIMMRGYMGAGRIDDAVSFLSEMTGRGVLPDTFCYNTLIKGFCDAGLLDSARALKLEMSKNDGFPDTNTYTIMICGLCKEGLVNEAHQIFKEMGSLGCAPSVMTFNSLIHGLCKHGNLDEAHILFYKMEMGKNPYLFLRLSQGANRIRDSDSLHKKVEELCQSGEVVRAYKLLQDIKDSGVMPDLITYNILIYGLCKEGNLDGAIKLFKKLPLMGQSPDVITYGTLIDSLYKVHRDGDAKRLLEDMMRSGYSHSLSICKTSMRDLCRKRKVSQSVALWFDYISNERKHFGEAETIRELRTHFEQGKIEEAVRGLAEMERERGSLESFPFTMWLIGYCQVDKIDEALKIFSVLSEFNIVATPASCVLLISYLCSHKRVAAALDVMLYTLRVGFFLREVVVNRLLRELCMLSKRDALELACRMRLAGYDLDTILQDSTKAVLYSIRLVEEP